MIKTSYATWIACIPMLILTWYCSELQNEYHTEKMRLQDRIWELEEDNGCDHLQYSNIYHTKLQLQHIIQQENNAILRQILLLMELK